MTAWSTPELKLYNKELIRREIQKSDACTKSQIARLTSLSVATCNTAINEMLKDREIIKVDQEELRMGRPADRFCYNRDYFHAVGMYLSDEHGSFLIEYAVADAEGNELVHERKVLQAIYYEDVEKVVDSLIRKDPLIRSLAIGIPGITNNGVVERCDIETIVGVDLEGQLSRKFKILTEVRNDMDFFAYGASHMPGNEIGNIAVMFFPEESSGTMGCGFVINGRVLRGHTKFAGELSYILESFGISRKQQAEVSGNHDLFMQYVSKMTLIVIATLDPEKIILMGSKMGPDTISIVRNYCAAIVTEQHIPKIEVNTDYESEYITGLLRVAINKVSFPLSDPI